MKKRSFLISMAVTLVIITVAAVFILKGVISELDTFEPYNTVSLFDGWKIGEFEGNLALYKGNGEELIETYDTPISSLREYDRNRINSGLYAVSYDEAKKYIEELTS